jgi:hypothetical protein
MILQTHSSKYLQYNNILLQDLYTYALFEPLIITLFLLLEHNFRNLLSSPLSILQ